MKKDKYILIMALLVAALPSDVQAQEQKEMEWIGGPTFLLQLGSFKILADPILGPKGKEAFRIKIHPVTGEHNAAIERFSDPAPFDASNIDVLLISHPHPDHIDPTAVGILDKNIKTITTFASTTQFRDWGFNRVKGLQWNDTVIYQKGKEQLTIIAVEAMHAGTDPLNTELGKVNGYVIEHTCGRRTYRIYWTGDTVWFEDINSLKIYGRPDLLIPNMGAVGNGKRGLDAAACLKIIEALDPKRVIPVHHTTFSHYTEPIGALQVMLLKTRYKNRLTVPALGTPAKL